VFHIAFYRPSPIPLSTKRFVEMNVYADPDGISWSDISSAMKAVNGLQSFFRSRVQKLNFLKLASQRKIDIGATEGVSVKGRKQ
jgi:hypothetical protein